MINPVQTRPVAQPSVQPSVQPSKQTSAPPTSKPAPVADSVKLSSAAQAALLESTETSAQTAKEANSGDVQAQHLLAKETANDHK